MKLEELYTIAEDNDVEVVNFKMCNNKSRIIDYNENTAIFMDYSSIKTESEEKELLAEELGHFYYNAYYSINSQMQDIKLAEAKAFKWKSLQLIKPSDFLECFQMGINSISEASEYLAVSPDVVSFALNYYKNNNQLTFI